MTRCGGGRVRGLVRNCSCQGKRGGAQRTYCRCFGILKKFYIYSFYIITEISQLYQQEQATSCCSHQPPATLVAHRHSSLALALRPAQVVWASTDPHHSGISQEAPALYNVTISTNGFRKEGKENPTCCAMLLPRRGTHTSFQVGKAPDWKLGEQRRCAHRVKQLTCVHSTDKIDSEPLHKSALEKPAL